MVNASLTIPSLAAGCETCKESRSVPGGAGVLTTPSAALVSPDGSVSTVTPGSEQGFSAGLGSTAIRAAKEATTLKAMTITISLKRATASKRFLPLLFISHLLLRCVVSGTGVSPVNHAQDAHATSFLAVPRLVRSRLALVIQIKKHPSQAGRAD